MIRFVQQGTGGVIGTPTTTVALTVSAGSLLVATIGDFQIGGDQLTVTDDKGNTWRSLGVRYSSANVTSAIWYATNVAAGLTNVTATGNPNRSFMNVQEYSGTTILPVYSADFVWTDASFPSTTIRTNPIQTAAGSFLFVGCFVNQVSSATTLDSATGFTGLTMVDNGFQFWSAYKITKEAVTLTQECKWTLGAAASNFYAHMGCWGESPTFMGQKPVGGRGASW